MRSILRRFIVFGALVTTACAGAALSRFIVPPAHAAVSQRWEHFCFTGGTGNAFNVDDVNRKLNEAGREGWELASVAVRYASGGHTVDGMLYCMKRPAP